MEKTEEVVSNVTEDVKKRTRKRGRDSEIVAPAKCTTKSVKKVKHKKKQMTVKGTKLEKERPASNVSSGMPSNVPKSRASVRISKSEGDDVRRSEAVETKGKRSSPLEELVCVLLFIQSKV